MKWCHTLSYYKAIDFADKGTQVWKSSIWKDTLSLEMLTYFNVEDLKSKDMWNDITLCLIRRQYILLMGTLGVKILQTGVYPK